MKPYGNINGGSIIVAVLEPGSASYFAYPHHYFYFHLVR